MDNNELRIGNETKQGKVICFYEQGVHVGFGKCFNFSQLEPIPLTEEWLLKFGFVKSINDKTLYKYLNFIYFKLEKEFNNSKDYDYISANLRGTKAGDFMCILYSVHQLQNLYFALTNEELTIKQ
jgi:hypothetical protein